MVLLDPGKQIDGINEGHVQRQGGYLKVVSNTEITASVPTGATTGPAKVTTPCGTLTSNVNFLVP